MKNEPNINNVRHSLAHLLAMAVKDLLPEAQLAIGPTIDNGFYYDFSLPRTLIPEDLPILEKKMRDLAKQNLTFKKITKNIEDALEWARTNDEPFKAELISELADAGEKEVTYYITGENTFTDLCKGPHVESTREIPADAFKLTKISGAYWRGDEKREQLQRVYGVAFATAKELRTYLAQMEEAAKRDHRKLGKEMDLYTTSKLVGSGLPLFTPRGTAMREELSKLVTEIQNKYVRYERVCIPHIAKSDLYKTSGHWDKFADDLFHVSGKSDEEMVMKPMNCPHHTQIFASKPRSYRDLPIRYGEITTCYRDEQPGELQGLSRVRSLTQDDGHVFCTEEQVVGEATGLMKAIAELYQVFDIKLTARLSKRDPENKEQYLGEDDQWEKAEATLEKMLKDSWKAEYEAVEGEAAFYGPKVDFIGLDSLGRSWQLATIQLDFNMPRRFELSYIDEQGESKTPVMIHRAILGSLERFMSIVIEHYGGKFPLWLAPEQVRIIAVNDSKEITDFVGQTKEKLQSAGLRVTEDLSAESVGKKIRTSEIAKVPITIVVGECEVKDGITQVRVRKDLNAKQNITVKDLAELTKKLQQSADKRQANL